MTGTPEPERRDYLAEGNAKQARKRVAVDILIRNREGQILVVNPTYKEGWDLPGGMAEANEPPTATIARELAEELGAGKIEVRGLLCLDWIQPHGPWDDLFAIVFDGGVLDPEEAAHLVPSDDEISEHRFLAPADAMLRLPRRQRDRARQALHALEDGVPRYLQNGSPPWQT